MKIILPVYGKEDGKLITDFVANYTWPPGTEIKVLHVLGPAADDESAQAAQKTAEELIAEFCGQLSPLLSNNVAEMTAQILSGSPVYEIVQSAHDWRANMIIMGYRTTAHPSSVFAGSVSKGVVLEAPCSVVVIRPPQDAMVTA